MLDTSRAPPPRNTQICATEQSRSQAQHSIAQHPPHLIDRMHAESIVSTYVVAFSFGMSITVMVYMTAHTSGGQLNPAVTTGCVAAGVCSPAQGIANIISQCIGTVLSAAFLAALVPEAQRDLGGWAVSAVPEGSTVGRAFLGAPLLPVSDHHSVVCVCYR